MGQPYGGFATTTTTTTTTTTKKEMFGLLSSKQADKTKQKHQNKHWVFNA